MMFAPVGQGISNLGENTIMYSKPYPGSANGYCLKFWYFLYNDGVGSLAVTVRSNGGYSAPVWLKSGNQGAMWRYASVVVQADVEFEVTFN